MTDNQLMALLISTITTGLIAQSINVPISQSYQPTLQGTPSDDAIFIWKLSENRYGFTGRSDVYDTIASQMNHTEVERIEVTYQIGALSIQDPSDESSTTAADYVRAVGRVLQGDIAGQTLQAHSVGIYRIQEMRQPYFKDDKGNYEASPSFDFTVAYNDVFIQSEPSTDLVGGTVTVI